MKLKRTIRAKMATTTTKNEFIEQLPPNIKQQMLYYDETEDVEFQHQRQVAKRNKIAILELELLQMRKALVNTIHTASTKLDTLNVVLETQIEKRQSSDLIAIMGVLFGVLILGAWLLSH